MHFFSGYKDSLGDHEVNDTTGASSVYIPVVVDDLTGIISGQTG